MKKCVLMLCLLFCCLLSVKAQVVNTKFGESKAVVSSKVENRFGIPDGSERNSIYYFDKTYAGYDWSYITFDFKYDILGKSHLNYVALSKDFKNQLAAIAFLKKVKDSLKYNFIKQKDETNVSQSDLAKTDDADVELYVYKSTEGSVL